MRKIGILTRRAGFNLGSSLQAYAMAKFIASEGFDTKIIDYDEYSGHPLWKVRPFIEDMQWRVSQHCRVLSSDDKYKYLKIRHQQYEKFRLFENSFLPLTPTTCCNYRQLRKASKDFDALVFGSDQIWSPLLFDPVFFGDFLPDKDIPTIAYAPSIGVDNPLMISGKQRILMGKMSYLSCREQQGADIIANITGKEVPVVLDPTLMVDSCEWQSLAATVSIPVQKPYLLCYFLGTNVHQDVVEKLSKNIGCRVVNIQMFNRMNKLDASEYMTDIGPCEFLALIKNAEWVCTDSYHATIFSFIFRRKMSVFERFKSRDRNNQNSRIKTLANVLKIGNAIINEGEDIVPSAHFDYSMGIESLDLWKKRSVEYLNKALG